MDSLDSTLLCSACQTVNPPQAVFCFACAQPLRDDAAAGMVSGTLTGLLKQDHLLKQRYVIVAQIGKGGFGAVYKAMDSQFRDRLVAVKEMSQSTLNPGEAAEAIEAFKREALLLAGLHHPNLPSIYDHFSDAGRWYLVMGFIEGDTLEQVLQKTDGHTLLVEEVLNIGIQLCDVLDYLHRLQPPLIFRDLKPANVMRTPAGHLYLIDFGIARHFKPGQLTDTMPLGSPGYAAPEQYGKAQTSVRADVYSLGVTLHQLLTGYDPSRTPFRLPSLSTHLSTDTNGEVILSRLDVLIKQMTEIDDQRRPANMVIVKQALEGLAIERVNRANKQERSNVFTLVDLGLDNSASEGEGEQRGQQQMQMERPALGWTYDPQPESRRKGLSRRRLLVSGLGGLAALGALGAGGLVMQQWMRGSVPIGKAILAVATPESSFYSLHTQAVDAVSWSPDGQFLASGSWDTTVQITDLANGTPNMVYTRHTDKVTSLSWLPNSRKEIIASASADKTVHIWYANTLQTLFIFNGHTDVVNSVAWSPNGRYIASASKDGTVQVWNAVNGKQFASLSHSVIVNALAWSPDGQQLVTADEAGMMHVWDVAAGGNLRGFEVRTLRPINSVAWSPDGTHIASAGGGGALSGNSGSVEIWNVRTGVKLLSSSSLSYEQALALAWSPNGHQLAAAGAGPDTLHVLDAHNGASVFVASGNLALMSVAWSPDGHQLLAGAEDGTMQLWTL